MNVLNKVCHTIFIIQFSCGLGLNNGARQMLLLTYLLLLTYNNNNDRLTAFDPGQPG